MSTLEIKDLHVSVETEEGSKEILRGVTLYGIESVMASKAKRLAAWKALAEELDPSKLDAMTHEIGLADAPSAGADILGGKVRGRLVVDVNR